LATQKNGGQRLRDEFLKWGSREEGQNAGGEKPYFCDLSALFGDKFVGNVPEAIAV
jgi:hypothetical protein